MLEELGQSRELACIPVIVLSAWDRYAHEQRVRNAGAKIFCQKPVDSGELLGRIQQLLRPKAVGKTRHLDRTARVSLTGNRRRDDGNENIDRR